MQDTPRANRLHISFFGRTNSGKSTLLNQLAGQEVSIVSNVAGTTTDPVYKAMELLPIGPVVLVDTAGFCDDSTLGEQRLEKTLEVVRKTDLAILVVSSEREEFSEEERYLALLQEHHVKTVCVVNQFGKKAKAVPLPGLPTLFIDASDPGKMGDFKKFLIQHADCDFEVPTLTGHLVKPGDLVVLVTPQDIQAPKGRLILPQVQTIRDLLDNDCKTVVLKPADVRPMLELLKEPPALVITDSQVFQQVNEMLPQEIPLTSFSVLMSENKGNIQSFVEGAKAISSLKPGDKVLVMESCTHHALPDDIAREKLPRMLQKYVGGKLQIEWFSGQGFPQNMDGYRLIFHCGGCMLNRKNMLSKISEAEQYGVPMTNFGIAIAYMNGMLGRICW